MAPKALPFCLSSLVLLIISAPTPIAADTVDDSRCNCYVSNTSDATYYSNHKFFDFRSLSQYQGKPQLLQDAVGATNAPLTSEFFNTDDWAKFWEVQNWNNSDSLGISNTSSSTVLRINSRNNVYIAPNTDPNPSSQTWLDLRTARQTMFQSSSEIATNDGNYQYLSMRMLARTAGAAGACTAMFTYRPADGPAHLQEADLEILTKYSRDQVQCTNQPSVDAAGQLVTNSTLNVTLPAGITWDAWAVYRMDWTPGRTAWYVNGQQLANISFQAPRDASRIHVNAWSDGGNWTGIMPFRTEAHLQIQWWELLYNTTDKPTTNECKAVCSVDTSGTTGRAVIISNSLAPGKLLDQRGALVGWVPSVAMLVMLLLSSSLFHP